MNTATTTPAKTANPAKETLPFYMIEAVDEALARVSSNFTPEQLPLLEELIIANVNWAEEFTKEFDTDLLAKYEKYSDLLATLSTFDTPSVGQIIKVTCANKKVFEKALITKICGDHMTVCVRGGGFILREVFAGNGLVMNVCGGYSLTVPVSALVDSDIHEKTYHFSGTHRVEPDCGIVISRPMKRWSLDDSNNELGFY